MQCRHLRVRLRLLGRDAVLRLLLLILLSLLKLLLLLLLRLELVGSCGLRRLLRELSGSCSRLGGLRVGRDMATLPAGGDRVTGPPQGAAGRPGYHHSIGEKPLHTVTVTVTHKQLQTVTYSDHQIDKHACEDVSS